MKKIYFFLLIACFSLSFLQAQDLTSKKGIPILPEAGEFGLAIDAVPFFEFAGNLFNGNAFNAAPSWDFPGLGHSNPMFTLSAKYFKNAKTALRGRIRLGYYAQTVKNTISDQTDPTGVNTVDDKWTNSSMDISFGAGIEKRKGKGRVQGVYGGMVNFLISTGGNKVTYGNTMTGTYPNPLSTDYPWVMNESGRYHASQTSSRTLKNNEGMTFGVGANLFLGVEYFFAPKISIGGEFSFGLMLATTGKDKKEVESWDAVGKTVKTTETKYGGKTTIGIDNSNSGGAINLSFYF